MGGLISYFLATRSSQMNVEVANDVDPQWWCKLSAEVVQAACWLFS